jgi:DNA-binding transcriptional regulator YiaG
MKRKSRSIRRGLGWTQAELASFLGVNVRTIQNWEAGRVTPRRKALAGMYLVGRMKKRNVKR